MTEENKKVVAIEEIEKELTEDELVEKANPQTDAPKKNAVAQKVQTLHQWQSLMIWVLLSLNQQTAIRTPQRNQHKQRTEVNKKAQDGDAKDETPDTEKGVTKVSHPGQKETIKAQKDHETINADARLWQILMVWVWRKSI